MANCREYCPNRDICKKFYPRCQGEEKLSPSECPISWRIEDILMDLKDAANVLNDPDEPDEVPFCDDYDGPETEEVP